MNNIFDKWLSFDLSVRYIVALDSIALDLVVSNVNCLQSQKA